MQDDESMPPPRNISFILRDSKESEHPYYEYDVSKIFAKPFEERLTELPKSKRQEEIERTNDPKYYKYHRIIGHPIEKCRTFKEQVMQLAKEGKITLGREDTEESD